MIITNSDYKVYVHTNKINGKMYVGITSQKPEERWKNGTGYDGSPKIFNAIKKYGWDNFEHDIFADNLTEEEAQNMEKILIKKLNLQNDKYGYNIKEGGNGGRIPEETKIKIGNANRGRKKSEEHCKHLSEAHKGVKLSPEHAKAISLGNKGRPRTEKEKAGAIKRGLQRRGKNHPLFGTTLSKEQLDKMHEAGKKYMKEHPEFWDSIKHPVMLIETNTIYKSIQDAADNNNICRSSISECASGKRKSAGGYHWKFV